MEEKFIFNGLTKIFKIVPRKETMLLRNTVVMAIGAKSVLLRIVTAII